MIDHSLDRRIKLPGEEHRCTTVLMDILEGYDGITEANFDVNSTRLKVEYNPGILSPERAMQLVHQAGRLAGSRAKLCASKSNAACADCALAMERGLADSYAKIAEMNMPVTKFENGVIDVRVSAQTGDGSALAMIESVFDQPIKEIIKMPQVSRRKLEIAFTSITLVSTLSAFIGSLVNMPVQIQAILFVIAFLFGGYYGLIDGIKAATEDHKLDVNLLMIVAALGAAIIGQPLEGAILLFLFSLSNTLQTYAMERNRRAIEKLLDLRPAMATVRRGSRLVTVEVEKVVIGDVVLVKPGERFPVDGEVLSGETDVNQAAITGESIPVHKAKGDEIFAGTVNGNGSVEVRSSRLAQDTTLARIVQMVEEAQNTRARTQTMLDRFEEIYAWVVLGGAALLTIIPIFFFGQEFMPTFYRAMTLLVVASPCALVISTPASILSAIANGARNGVLFKGGMHLEKTAGIKVIAFDKTGTLTSGKPSLRSIVPFGDTDEATLIQMVAAAESRSEHPLGQAIIAAAEVRGLELPHSSSFRAVPGYGVEARVDGKPVWVGNRRLFENEGKQIPPAMLTQIQSLEEQGQTVMIAWSNEKWLGVLGLADTMREDAPLIIKRLKENGVARVVMLTGDHHRVAQAIAAEAGVDEVHAGLLPEDKVNLLKDLRQKHGQIAMIGDGVNDAPALAAADVGIAMGGAGSDVALETADIVLMSDDLTNLPHAMRLAHKAQRVVWQNLAFSLAVIVVLVVSAFGFNLALPLGVVGHEGSTVLVVLNGLRLLGLAKI